MFSENIINLMCCMPAFRVDKTLAETVADIVIGPESSDVLVPRGNLLKMGFGRDFSRGMVTSCSKDWKRPWWNSLALFLIVKP